MAAQSSPNRDRSSRGFLPLFLALLLIPTLTIVRLSESCDWRVLSGYAFLVSLATFHLYWRDKARAQSGGWRTPETTLHLAELLGGWPGALLAQRNLRHKTAKTRYQVTFWTIVALHQLLALDFLLGWPLVGAVTGL